MKIKHPLDWALTIFIILIFMAAFAGALISLARQ